MRWSLRSTLLVIVLPLTLATLSLSASRISGLVVHRDDLVSEDVHIFLSFNECFGELVQIRLTDLLGELSAIQGSTGGPVSVHARPGGPARVHVLGRFRDRHRHASAQS